MDWKAFISELASCSGRSITFRPPALASDLNALETEFNFELPQQYRELMLQTNGVFDEFDCPIIDDVTSVQWINRDTRSDSHDCYMPLDHLFFISSAYGNGDLIGYGIRRDKWEHPDLYRWDHENDSRIWEAPDIKTWIEWGFKKDDES